MILLILTSASCRWCLKCASIDSLYTLWKKFKGSEFSKIINVHFKELNASEVLSVSSVGLNSKTFEKKHVKISEIPPLSKFKIITRSFPGYYSISESEWCKDNNHLSIPGEYLDATKYDLKF